MSEFPKAIVVDEPERLTFRVYVEMSRSNETRYFSDSDGLVHEVALGAEPPLYMRIDYYIAEALGKVLAPRPEVTENHLYDAIGVRDRALALVENIVNKQLGS